MTDNAEVKKALMRYHSGQFALWEIEELTGVKRWRFTENLTRRSLWVLLSKWTKQTVCGIVNEYYAENGPRVRAKRTTFTLKRDRGHAAGTSA